jgi:hypothetical protein
MLKNILFMIFCLALLSVVLFDGVNLGLRDSLVMGFISVERNREGGKENRREREKRKRKRSQAEMIGEV